MKEKADMIEKEALKKYPKQWRGTTPSERVAYFDPNEEIRIGYIAGRTVGIDENEKLKKENEELKKYNKLQSEFWEYWKQRCEAAEKSFELFTIWRNLHSNYPNSLEALNALESFESADKKLQALKNKTIIYE